MAEATFCKASAICGMQALDLLPKPQKKQRKPKAAAAAAAKAALVTPAVAVDGDADQEDDIVEDYVPSDDENDHDAANGACHGRPGDAAARDEASGSSDASEGADAELQDYTAGDAGSEDESSDADAPAPQRATKPGKQQPPQTKHAARLKGGPKRGKPAGKVGRGGGAQHGQGGGNKQAPGRKPGVGVHKKQHQKGKPAGGKPGQGGKGGKGPKGQKGPKGPKKRK